MNAQLPLAYPIRPEAAQAPTSGIVDAMSYGRGRPGLIPLWVGEGHLATPAFIGDALRASLACTPCRSRCGWSPARATR